MSQSSDGGGGGVGSGAGLEEAGAEEGGDGPGPERFFLCLLHESDCSDQRRGSIFVVAFAATLRVKLRLLNLFEKLGVEDRARRLCSRRTPTCRGRSGGSDRSRRERLLEEIDGLLADGAEEGLRGHDELLDDSRDDVVVVRLGDFGAVEGAGDELFVGAEVVDENLAVDLRCVLSVRPCQRSSVSSDSPSTSRSISRPIQSASLRERRSFVEASSACGGVIRSCASGPCCSCVKACAPSSSE